MRRTALTLVVAFLVVVPVTAAAAVDATRPSGPTDSVAGNDAAQEASNPCVGTMRTAPGRPTLYSVQGIYRGNKTDNMVVGARSNGTIVGVHDDRAAGRWWTYDIDRLPSGNILTAGTKSRHTLIEEIDPVTGEHVSERPFENVKDAHDVDLINGDELLMNDKPNDGDGDRVLVYNLTRGEVTWSYYFRNHTDVWPRDGGDGVEDDWTHNNDVEQIREGVVMISVRNFDQVVAVDRSTKEVEWILGEDDNTSILHRQHNPDYLETEDGEPTVLVADSRNDRVVEYTREDGSWNRTWVLRGDLDEPRDADRLPNGNTLVADRHSHRILEVTPDGEVVWEVYAPYQPYDVERLGTGDESSGPTMLDADATGAVEVSGSADPSASELRACYNYLRNHSSTRLVPADAPPPPDPGTDSGTGTDSGGSDGEDGDAGNGSSGDGGDGESGDGSSGDGGDTTDGGATDDGDDGGLLGTPTDSSSGFGPGFGVATAALAVLGVFAALVVRRRA